MPYEIVLFLKLKANKWQVVIHVQFLVITSGENLFNSWMITTVLPSYQKRNKRKQNNKISNSRTKYINEIGQSKHLLKHEQTFVLCQRLQAE